MPKKSRKWGQNPVRLKGESRVSIQEAEVLPGDLFKYKEFFIVLTYVFLKFIILYIAKLIIHSFMTF